MKVVYICAVLLVLFLIVQTVIAASSKKTEQQIYRVVKKEKDFEIRFYPEATMASLNLAASNYQGVASNGFRKLANYIFGGNQANQSIAMTIPVVLEPSAGNQDAHVSFYLTDKNPPQPMSSTVQITHQTGRYVAAITVTGIVRQSKLDAIAARLHATLIAQGRECSAIPEFRFYNPPWRLFGHRSDVLFTLTDMPSP